MGAMNGAAKLSMAQLAKSFPLAGGDRAIAVEDFSLDRLKRLTDAEIRARYASFLELTRVLPLA